MKKSTSKKVSETQVKKLTKAELKQLKGGGDVIITEDTMEI